MLGPRIDQEFEDEQPRSKNHLSGEEERALVNAGMLPHDKESKRNPVEFRFDLLNWSFLKAMAVLAHIGFKVYGEWSYTPTRFQGDKSPINHMAEHQRQYIAQESHDKLGSPKWHLVAIAFNAMIEFFYFERFGPPTIPPVVVTDSDK